jgi:DNA-binding MarR family transcriptional regulator
MNATPAVYGQFGFTLGLAERTLTAVLRDHLAQRGVEPETWYALRLIAAGGPGLPREELTTELASSRTLNADTALEVIARLEAEGLIRGDSEIDLTTEGEALFRSLREYIAGPAIRLLSQFDLEDIETTVRTLQAIAERARSESELVSQQ